MSAQWSAIPAYEVHNTRREWIDGDGRFYASVKLMVAWDDRFKLIQDLYTSSLGVGGPPNGTGYNPRAYPGGAATASSGAASPDMTSIGVTSASISSWSENYEPRDANNEVMDYKSSAFVDVQYGRRFNIEESIEFDAEVISQSHRLFLWFTKINANDKQIVHELEVPVTTRYDAILTRKFIGLARSELSGPLVPDFSTLHECVGHTNATEYQSIQLGNMKFKKGTLLLMEPIVTPSTDMQNRDGNNANNFSQSGFSVELKFLYRKGVDEVLQGPNGTSKASDEDTHDLFWRPRKDTTGYTDKGGWDRLLIKEEATDKTLFKFFAPYKRHSLISNTGWLVPSLYPTPVA